MKSFCLFVLVALLAACAQLPENITPVSNFELDKYAGTWYEIARLDHRFERGLEQVTATYLVNDDGSVQVINKGFSVPDNEWDETIGKAAFVGDTDVGLLKVTFFRIFSGNYLVFELDKENYQYAFVTGSTKSLWFLSRTPTVSNELKVHFVNTVAGLGYNVEELIFVRQQTE